MNASRMRLHFLAWLFACLGATTSCSAIAEPFGSGTGFFITEDGYIVTNDHVVHDMTKVTVRTNDGSELPAKVVRLDTANDIAVLKIDTRTARPLAIRSSASVAKGSSVFTIGFPLVTLQGTEAKITEGIISSQTGFRGEANHFQISVPIQPGNSGGPLIDTGGNVVGIASATLGTAATFADIGFLPENVNYAVKSDYLSALISTIPSLQEKLKKRSNAANLPLTTLVEMTEKSVVIVYGPVSQAQPPQAVTPEQPPQQNPSTKPRYENDAAALELNRQGMKAYNEKRYGDALHLLGRAAELGNADAQVNLGYMYDIGIGVGKDQAEAVKWYAKAAAQDYALGQYNLGTMYESGSGVERNGAETEKWYRKAAEHGLAKGQRALGALYQQGELVAKNSNEARKWLHKAAAQNDVLAHFDLGCIYQFGLGVPRDYAEAEKWYRLPVEKGNADAISNMKQLKESIAAEEEQR